MGHVVLCLLTMSPDTRINVRFLFFCSFFPFHPFLPFLPFLPLFFFSFFFLPFFSPLFFSFFFLPFFPPLFFLQRDLNLERRGDARSTDGSGDA